MLPRTTLQVLTAKGKREIFRKFPREFSCASLQNVRHVAFEQASGLKPH
jgi:hypothetical protein